MPIGPRRRAGRRGVRREDFAAFAFGFAWLLLPLDFG
ncbi:hypothetical protein OG2516_12531 [Oceanicola granulosus HTCC2516]|uniref:Uncharacterized protein n=1 Tax=Oceanicola granulosus (strain ATCC BAA-861 / DSM 15982 / KCTC 12143 / HTCC2516) TaxID=314256 RepID=Q2CAG0_OCEGH|nr:hypothetical protein OG2516_12531 [Oceanicola granulosus HTCC2516]